MHCTSPNGPSGCCCLRAGDTTFEICHPAFELILWVWVWSYSFLFTYGGFCSALTPHCVLCWCELVRLSWETPTALYWELLPALGTSLSLLWSWSMTRAQNQRSEASLLQLVVYSAAAAAEHLLLHSKTNGSSFKCSWKWENGALLFLPRTWPEDVGKQDQIYSRCNAEQQQVLLPSVPTTPLWPGYRLVVL